MLTPPISIPPPASTPSHYTYLRGRVSGRLQLDPGRGFRFLFVAPVLVLSGRGRLGPHGACSLGCGLCVLCA